jgi:hypothetical protein
MGHLAPADPSRIDTPPRKGRVSAEIVAEVRARIKALLQV